MARDPLTLATLLLDAVVFDDGVHAGEVGVRSWEKLAAAAHMAAENRDHFTPRREVCAAPQNESPSPVPPAPEVRPPREEVERAISALMHHARQDAIEGRYSETSAYTDLARASLLRLLGYGEGK